MVDILSSTLHHDLINLWSKMTEKQKCMVVFYLYATIAHLSFGVCEFPKERTKKKKEPEEVGINYVQNLFKH